MDDIKFEAVLASIRSGLPTHKALSVNKLSKSWFYTSIAADEALADRYTRAKAFQCVTMADEIVELADTRRLGVVVTEKPDGTETKTADMVERTRLQIEARKWLLAKLLPKVYGDKLELAGKDGAPVLVIRDQTGKP